MTVSQPKPIRMRDIAQMADVSAGTVSRVLNGQPGVGPDTRRRVEQMIRQYTYRANASAQHLSTGRSRTIGVVFPIHPSAAVMHPIYPALIAGLADAAEARGYDLLILSASSVEATEHVRDSVRRRRVDGVVLPASGPKEPLLRDIAAGWVPTVLIGHRHRVAAWVDSTQDLAAAELTNVMLDGGRRELVLLNGPDEVWATRIRAAGFWGAVKARPDLVSWASEYRLPYDADKARSAARLMLSRHARPTAVVCGNDVIAVGVLQAARELGLSVPDDVAVSGFDDRSWAAATSPPLSTARMPLREIGTEAGRLLFALIEQRQVTCKHIVLPTEVVLRGTTPAREADGGPTLLDALVSRPGRGDTAPHHVMSVGAAPRPPRAVTEQPDSGSWPAAAAIADGSAWCD